MFINATCKLTWNIAQNSVKFTTAAGTSRQFPLIWLRDHDRSAQGYNHGTFQRKVETFLLSPMALEKMTNENGLVSATWADGSVTSYPVSFLEDIIAAGEPVTGVIHPVHRTWVGAELFDIYETEDIPTYDELTSPDTQYDSRKRMMQTLLKYGVCWLKDTPSDHAATVAAAEAFSTVQSNVFGHDWSFTADGARSDTAYTTMGIGLHTDASYYTQPMGIQIFHVLQHNGTGGATMLSDGFAALEELDSEALDFLSQYVLRHEYKETGRPGHHVHSVGTVVDLNKLNGTVRRLRFNNFDRAPIVPENSERFYHAYGQLGNIINAPKLAATKRLEKGVVIFVDNFRVMHGRTGFDGNRTVSGAYLTRDDWVSTARAYNILPSDFY